MLRLCPCAREEASQGVPLPSFNKGEPCTLCMAPIARLPLVVSHLEKVKACETLQRSSALPLQRQAHGFGSFHTPILENVSSIRALLSVLEVCKAESSGFVSRTLLHRSQVDGPMSPNCALGLLSILEAVKSILLACSVIFIRLPAVCEWRPPFCWPAELDRQRARGATLAVESPLLWDESELEDLLQGG
eukprot:scaffold179959_cov18-Tisochrysis_lutea.AAC.1